MSILKKNIMVLVILILCSYIQIASPHNKCNTIIKSLIHNLAERFKSNSTPTTIDKILIAVVALERKYGYHLDKEPIMKCCLKMVPNTESESCVFMADSLYYCLNDIMYDFKVKVENASTNVDDRLRAACYEICPVVATNAGKRTISSRPGSPFRVSKNPFDRRKMNKRKWPESPSYPLLSTQNVRKESLNAFRQFVQKRVAQRQMISNQIDIQKKVQPLTLTNQDIPTSSSLIETSPRHEVLPTTFSGVGNLPSSIFHPFAISRNIQPFSKSISQVVHPYTSPSKNLHSDFPRHVVPISRPHTLNVPLPIANINRTSLTDHTTSVVSTQKVPSSSLSSHNDSSLESADKSLIPLSPKFSIASNVKVAPTLSETEEIVKSLIPSDEVYDERYWDRLAAEFGYPVFEPE